MSIRLLLEAHRDEMVCIDTCINGRMARNIGRIKHLCDECFMISIHTLDGVQNGYFAAPLAFIVGILFKVNDLKTAHLNACNLKEDANYGHSSNTTSD